MAQERHFSGVLLAFSLPDRYAIQILSTNIFIFLFFEETISLQ